MESMALHIKSNKELVLEIAYGASLAIWDHTMLPATRHK